PESGNWDSTLPRPFRGPAVTSGWVNDGQGESVNRAAGPSPNDDRAWQDERWGIYRLPDAYLWARGKEGSWRNGVSAGLRSPRPNSPTRLRASASSVPCCPPPPPSVPGRTSNS